MHRGRSEATMPRARLAVVALVIASIAAITILQRAAAAHCDTMDGPVVLAGQKALDTGKLDEALVWVPKESESELRALFKKIMTARKKGTSTEVLDLLERYFLETLVRIHRTGEGEPYTGIRPAGTKIEPAIVAADGAIAEGSVEDLTKALGGEIAKGLRTRFAAVQESRDWKTVAGGRAFVRSYTEYLEYVEKVAAAVHGAEH
jgi:hypothetical protein